MRFWLANFLVSFLFFLVACNQNSSPNPESISRVVVAIDATFIPMSFINGENQLDGFEVDLIKEVAQEANLSCELVNVEWSGLFAGLITKKFDLVISSVGIVEERKERVAFSIPYLQSGAAILARNDIKNVASLEDLEKIKESS